MNRRDPDTPDTPLPPACRATVDRLQQVLDGELEASALEADPHPAACPACRGRIAAARLILSALAHPAPVALPPGMTDAIVSAVAENRYARIRRRSYAVSVGVLAALAASVALVVWLTSQPPQQPQMWLPQGPSVANGAPELAPAPREVPARPQLRIGEELAKAGSALRDTTNPITEPAAAGSDVIVKLTDALTRPMTPMAELDPTPTALAELPEAARTGLAPVTNTLEKGFTRLIHDVSLVTFKPKS
jgi:hypothetical protein